MGRFVGKQISDWGNYVHIKINAPELLIKEIKKLKNKGKDKEIFISSVTDPYQGIEAKYKLTRQCLEILAEYQIHLLMDMVIFHKEFQERPSKGNMAKIVKN